MLQVILTADHKEASEFCGYHFGRYRRYLDHYFSDSWVCPYIPPKTGVVYMEWLIMLVVVLHQAAMGPFYCPTDQKVYIDTSFFQAMRQQMGIGGEQNQTEFSRSDQAGDFAQALAMAHEVGHHIQTLIRNFQASSESTFADE